MKTSLAQEGSSCKSYARLCTIFNEQIQRQVTWYFCFFVRSAIFENYCREQ